MSETKINPVVRLLPSLGDLAFLMPLVFLFGRMEGASTLLADGDTGWHLRAGEWMLANGRIADRDLFSFTRPGEPWFAWEWLWDVAFAWLSRYGGLAMVVLVNLVLLGAISVLMYRLARRVSGNAPVALAVTMVATAASSVHWLARPHMFTLLFVVVFLTLLEREPGWRGMALLAGLTVLWTNLHGGFFVGIVLLLLYGAGQLMTALTTAEAGERVPALRRARLFGAGATACAAGTLINPYGWRLHAHIIEYLRDPSLFNAIDEFVPLNFGHPAYVYFETVLLVGVAAVGWSVYRRRFTHALLAAMWAHLALCSARNIPIFVSVAAPIAALAITEWLHCLEKARVADWIRAAVSGALRRAGDLGAIEKIGRLHAISITAVAVLAALLYAPAPPERFQARFPGELFPVKAAAALQNAGLIRRVYASDQWGDYLIYSQYPERRVFVDGRSDFYGRNFSKSTLQIWTADHRWQALLDQYGVDAVLVPPRAPIAAAMKESPRWWVAYDDGFAIVFRPVDSTVAPDIKFSAVGSSSGSMRDRAITKSQACDPSITTTNVPKTQEQTI